MSFHNQASPLLTIPLELREQIYEEALSNSTPNVQLLQTCRQIYAESQQFLFRRVLSFGSQAELSKWLDAISSDNLRHVRSISLHLQDVDLSPVLSSLPSGDMSRFLCWRLYEKELDNLTIALHKLPNIRKFSILASAESRSYLYREFLSAFAMLLGQCYEQLSHITILGRHESLLFLASMQNLKSIRFNGSSTTPTETASILSNLPHLTSLEITAQPFAPSSLEQLPNNAPPPIIQCFTPPVLKQLHPLSSFTIQEQLLPPSKNSLFFGTDMIEALSVTHTTSLRTLRLSLGYTPDAETLDTLSGFLAASSVQELDFSWPDLDPELLGALFPRSLRELRVAVDSDALAFDVLYVVIKKRGDLPMLSEIVLVDGCDEPDEMEEDDEFVAGEDLEEEIQIAVRELRRLGVRTLRGRIDECEFE